VKVWAGDGDFVLSQLCQMLMLRNLYHVDITNKPCDKQLVAKLVENAGKKYPISKEETSYFVFTDTIKNNAYKADDGSIRILMKDGTIQDITAASDNSNLEALAKTVKKYILCYTKGLI
ncbi:MAG: HD domain-containing protein, partial [Mucilaginibacter sp.]